MAEANKTPKNKRNYSETDISPIESNKKKTVLEEGETKLATDPLTRLQKDRNLTQTVDQLKKSNDTLSTKIDNLMSSVSENSTEIVKCNEESAKLGNESAMLKGKNSSHYQVFSLNSQKLTLWCKRKIITHPDGFA